MKQPRLHHEGSLFVRHVPCPACGSSDANALYDDGHMFCFACGEHVNGDGSTTNTGEMKKPKVKGLIEIDEVRGLRTRKITDATCKHFGYGYGTYKGETVQVAPYYNADGQLVAQKLRFPDKRFLVVGDIKSALPFGSHSFVSTGKMITVTEGEIDALTMSQLQDNKWPVVSIGCGAGPQIRKYFAKHKDYFSGFERVNLMFDMDAPGREATKVAAEVLGGRARICELPLKDPNEMLVAGRGEELVNAMWRAKEYRPEGVIDMADLKESVMARPTRGLSWPFETLTNLTYGMRSGELYALGAGTGIGKTDFFTQCVKHLITEHKVPVGVFALEQSPTETATRIAGKLAEKTFHIPDSGWKQKDLDKAWDALMQSGKVFLYDSFGNNEWEVVKEKIEYLHHAHDVRFFFLDHLTAFAAWQDDERKALDSIMSEMGALVKKLDCTILFISHLATPEGKPHEEGGRVMIRHFRGSRAIGFWSHYMFGMERSQQDDDPEVRATTTFRVLKDRYTGRATGETFYLGYDHGTGMLYEKNQKSGEHYGFRAAADDVPNTDEEEI